VAPINNAVTYVWTIPTGAVIASGSGTNSITVNFNANAASGNITVSGNSICGNGPTSPPFAVTVISDPANAGNITGPSGVCQGETGVVYSTDPIPNATSYLWTVPAGFNITAGATTNSITVTIDPAATGGTITVAGVNSCSTGGSSNGFGVTVNPVPPAPVILFNDLTGELSSGASAGNQWYLEGVLISGATSQTYVPTASGHYTDIVTVSGCSSAESNDIYVLMTGIEPLLNGSSVSVYPNPGDGLFTLVISTKDQLKLDLSVVNALGVTIYQQKDMNIQGSRTSTLDLRSQPDGVYSLILKT
jgi:hypothetical protein